MLPSRAFDHKIVLTPRVVPVCCHPYHYSYNQKSELEWQVNEQLVAGLIRPSQSPFASPTLLVKKKDNGAILCGLSHNEQAHCPRSISHAIYGWTSGRVIWDVSLFQTRSQVGLPSNLNAPIRHREDGIQYAPWALWIYCHALRINEFSDDFPSIDEPHFPTFPLPVHANICRWHLGL